MLTILVLQQPAVRQEVSSVNVVVIVKRCSVLLRSEACSVAISVFHVFDVVSLTHLAQKDTVKVKEVTVVM